MVDRVGERAGGRTLLFFLEWEKRAMNPSTMAARLARYLRCYYSSNRPLDDHGHRPLVMVVFDDYLAERNFLGVARGGMERAGVNVPLWVSPTGAGRGGAVGTGLAQPGRAGAQLRVHSSPQAEVGRMANPGQVPGKQQLAKTVEPKSPGG